MRTGRATIRSVIPPKTEDGLAPQAADDLRQSPEDPLERPAEARCLAAIQRMARGDYGVIDFPFVQQRSPAGGSAHPIPLPAGALGLIDHRAPFLIPSNSDTGGVHSVESDKGPGLIRLD